ncbi:hypothetical protein [Natrarchaeobius chitinivorans]|nr:hypothetical protein [Natrarchaeobius chitinivorans]
MKAHDWSGVDTRSGPPAVFVSGNATPCASDPDGTEGYRLE